jgi:hypothetical protein
MSRAGRLVARGLLLLAAGGLFAWSAFVLQAYWGAATLAEVGTRIMAGETLRPEVMAAAEPEAQALTRAALPPPELMRASALLRVRQVEDAIASGQAVGGNPALVSAETQVRAALAVTPTDPFLWFALAWLGKARDGFAPAQVPYLAASYRTGSREGWLALHRNALAVTVLPALPPNVRGAALTEFRDLVASNYIPAAADILKGPGWGQRDLLLASLADLPEERRAAFAQVLRWQDIDAEVPGVPRRRDRPWR